MYLHARGQADHERELSEVRVNASRKVFDMQRQCQRERREHEARSATTERAFNAGIGA
jgi:hypothetical protein